MDLIEVTYKEEFLDHNEKCTTAAEHSPSADSYSTDGIYGEPSVFPRLGEQYQVEIPSLVSETQRIQLQNTTIDNLDSIDFNFYIGKGLAIPIIWVHHVADHVRHAKELLGTAVGSDTLHSHATIDSKMAPKYSTMSGFPLDSSNSYHTMPEATSKVEISDNLVCSDNLRNISAPLMQSRKTRGYIPLPGSAKAPWSDSESQSFLLGLYIFGKNLVQVQRFVESKDMGDVLSFYYGKFYRSDAQHRWVECRKIRSRRCILGHRIFTGWRQQELLSRLLPGRSKEFQDTLLEVIKAFTEGTASLEEFIFTLKAMVGTEALVEAVGIGKGKQDLTGIILDHVRTNRVVPARPEIPVGKACSSLTSGEIIKFLTGDFRLSKAKSNDLFWEAVWPRLLARGWHSEQPKDLSSHGSKNALVFLIPGVKKFSRKKLTKGNHYFDSVSDVLSKVASDPRLLELEVEEGNESSKVNDERQWNAETADIKMAQNGLSDHRRSCYLRPRLPDCNSDFMKFTVVDTSLAQVGMPSKVRELRSLPADATSSYRPNHRGETNSDSSTEQSSSGDTSSNTQGESDQRPSDYKKSRNSRRSTSIRRVQSTQSDHSVTDPKSSLPGNGHDLDGQCYGILIDKPSVKDTKYQFSPRVKCGEENSTAPASKRRRLASCKSVGTGPRSFSIPRDDQLKQREEYLQLESLGSNKGIAAEDGISQEETNGAATSHERSQPRTFIDLNLHPQDFDSEGPVDMEVEGSQDDLRQKESFKTAQQLDDSQASESNIVLPDGEPTNGRRHSTRNRPPTTKALEALACGFLTARKERGTRTPGSGNGSSRSSRRARKNVVAPLPASDTNLITRNPISMAPSVGMDAPNPISMAPSVGMDEDYCQTTNHMSLFDSSHGCTERKEAHELLGVL